jgi:hypothetical protein
MRVPICIDLVFGGTSSVLSSVLPRRLRRTSSVSSKWTPADVDARDAIPPSESNVTLESLSNLTKGVTPAHCIAHPLM